MSETPIESPIESATEEARAGAWEGRGRGGIQHLEHAQGSMFDEPTPTAGLEAYASAYEEIDSTVYDASDSLEDFSQLGMETDLETGIEQEATSFEAPEFQESKSETASASEPATEQFEQMEHSSTGRSAPEQSSPEQSSTAEVAQPSAEVAEVESSILDPVTVLTADDFSALEDRILRAVSLVKREREARIAAEGRVAALEWQKQELEAQSLRFETHSHELEGKLKDHEALSPVVERLEREVDTLRAEREQVRQRVERLLGQLDALEL